MSRMFAATAAAVIAPSVAASMPSRPTLVKKNERPAKEPTKIEKLGQQVRAMKREYRKAGKNVRKLELALEREIEKPDPSIVFGPDNDADGLEYNLRSPSSEPHTLNHYIWPQRIEDALSNYKPNRWEKTEIDGCFAMIQRAEPAPLHPGEALTKERLEARLRLSLAYKARIAELSNKLGLTALNKKMEDVAQAEGDTMSRILKLRAQTREDFAVKIQVARDFVFESDVCESLVKDIERFVVTPREVPALLS